MGVNEERIEPVMEMGEERPRFMSAPGRDVMNRRLTDTQAPVPASERVRKAEAHAPVRAWGREVCLFKQQ